MLKMFTFLFVIVVDIFQPHIQKPDEGDKSQGMNK